MWITTRRWGESILIGDDIEVIIQENTVRGARIAISAPKEMKIRNKRKEKKKIYDVEDDQTGPDPDLQV